MDLGFEGRHIVKDVWRQRSKGAEGRGMRGKLLAKSIWAPNLKGKFKKKICSVLLIFNHQGARVN